MPASAAAYATVYLQPSAGQRLNLGTLLGRIPGFADPAALDGKIHEVTQRLLGQQGLDYAADLRPWLGDQVSLALLVNGGDLAGASTVLLASVREPDAARTALGRIAADRGTEAAAETYEGTVVMSGDGLSYAVLDDLAIIGATAGDVRAALDADAGRSPSLAGDAAFVAAMRRIPADHLAAAYLNLLGLAGAAGLGDQLNGFATASLALVVEPGGLRLAGEAPFDPGTASADARQAFALGAGEPSLPARMPASTQVELTVLGLRQSFVALEEAIAATPELQQTADAITQLRAVAALGLGLDLDADVLPLFDREAAVALSGIDADLQPVGQLLLRPADPAAASASVARIHDALAARGAAITTSTERGVTITTIAVPTVIAFSYAIHDDVIVAGLGAEDVAAAVRVDQSAAALADGERYRAAWGLAGARAGNELFVDVGAIVDSLGAGLGVTGDERDILLQVGAFGFAAPSVLDHVEFHAGLSAR